MNLFDFLWRHAYYNSVARAAYTGCNGITHSGNTPCLVIRNSLATGIGDSTCLGYRPSAGDSGDESNILTCYSIAKLVRNSSRYDANTTYFHRGAVGR